MWAGCWRTGPRSARVRRKETAEVRIGYWPVLADDHSHDPLSSSSSLPSLFALLSLLSFLLSLSSLSLSSSFFSWPSSLHPSQPKPPYPGLWPYPSFSRQPPHSCHTPYFRRPSIFLPSYTSMNVTNYTSCTLNRHQSRTCFESQHQHILPHLNSLCKWWHN